MDRKPSYRDRLKYLSLRAIRAKEGTFDKANTYSWLALACISLASAGAGYKMLEPSSIGDYLLITSGSIAAAIGVIYIWRFLISVPAEIYQEQKLILDEYAEQLTPKWKLYLHCDSEFRNNKPLTCWYLYVHAQGIPVECFVQLDLRKMGSSFHPRPNDLVHVVWADDEVNYPGIIPSGAFKRALLYYYDNERGICQPRVRWNDGSRTCEGIGTCWFVLGSEKQEPTRYEMDVLVSGSGRPTSFTVAFTGNTAEIISGVVPIRHAPLGIGSDRQL